VPLIREDMADIYVAVDGVSYATMEKKVIEDAPVKVSWRFKNRLKQPFGPTFSVTGTLKSAFLPNIDTSGNEQAFYSIIVDCDERMA
jgi:hypothetical protein